MFTGGGDLGKAAAAAVVASLLTFGGLAYSPVMAADSDTKVAVIFDDKGSLKSTDATISHQILEDPKKFPEGEGQSITLGKGAHAYMQGGSKAKNMLFGMKKAAGAIAIGEGSQALSQSIAIGNRTYTGDIGDVNISNYNNFYGDGGAGSGVGSVLLGTNSYTGGTLSTLIGDYSIMSTAYPNAYDSHYGSYLQNAGAVSVGALNSIESATSGNYNSGVANSIVGLANKTNNANGALIYGAGNEITNSTSYISAPTSGDSVKSAAESLRTSIKNNPGGAALAIGGGNTIDHSIRSQVMGVNNKLTGNSYYSEYSSQYNMIDGYNNTASNVNHAYVIGANNIIQGKKFSDATKNGVLNDADWEKSQQDDNLIVIGDNHTLANDVANNIIFGTADEILTTSVSDIVMMGHNADVQTNNGVAIGSGAIVKKEAGVGGVAIGSGSIANVGAGQQGYYVKHDQRSEEGQGYPFKNNDSAWISRAGAVSVGDTTNEDQSKWITRQITGVAAGTNDTDAVNVAQLKSAQIHYYSVKVTQEGAEGDKSNYNNDGATGEGSIAIGPFASAEGNHSLALGYGAQTTHSDVLDEKKNMDDNTAVGYNSQAGYRSTALGYKSQATGLYAVALGTDALAEKDNSTAVGMNAQATGKQATALGALAKASGESATAVGEGANALADNSSAVGQGAIVEEGASKGTALGYQAKVLKDAENSIALGASSQVSGANSIAIGMSAQVSGAKSVAIGQGAVVSVENSVALGQGSVASGNLNDYNVMSLTIPNLGSSYNVSGGYPSGIVSVGNDKVVRTITNVAAGRVTSTSTDAVNGSELYAVATEAAKHATVEAAENGHITVKEGINQGKGIKYTIGLNTEGLAALTDGLKFAGDDGQSDNSKIISRKLKEQLNIIGGATDTVEAANIGVVKKMIIR